MIEPRSTRPAKALYSRYSLILSCGCYVCQISVAKVYVRSGVHGLGALAGEGLGPRRYELPRSFGISSSTSLVWTTEVTVGEIHIFFVDIPVDLKEAIFWFKIVGTPTRDRRRFGFRWHTGEVDLDDSFREIPRLGKRLGLGSHLGFGPGSVPKLRLFLFWGVHTWESTIFGAITVAILCHLMPGQ